MQPRFQTVFTLLSSSLQNALHPLLAADDFPAFFTPAETEMLQAATAQDRRALTFALLPLAAACAVTPLSHFNVGAVAWGKSGALYFGANMEFSGTPIQQTVHAEQSAIAHAWMHGEQELDAISVNYTPCGHCRQFMNELNSGIRLHIHLADRPPATLADYLPDSFGPADLSIDNRLLDINNHGFLVQGDALTQAAISAANRSHAPYTQSWSGVALEASSGKIYVGAYAENAAFNPSLPPLQVALIQLNMAGENLTTIRRAVLAEAPGAHIVQRQSMHATLQALGCDNIAFVALSR